MWAVLSSKSNLAFLYLTRNHTLFMLCMSTIITITGRLEIKRRYKKERYRWTWQMTSYAFPTWLAVCTRSSTWPLRPPPLSPHSEQLDPMNERTRQGTSLHIHTVLTLIPTLPSTADILRDPSNHNRYPSGHLSYFPCNILQSTELRREKPQTMISELSFAVLLLTTPCWRLRELEQYWMKACQIVQSPVNSGLITPSRVFHF